MIQRGRSPRYVLRGKLPGLRRPGTLDLLAREPVVLPDGSVATVRSITITTPEGAYLLPTIIGGHAVSNEQAVQHFRRTGDHLGLFSTEPAANRYAERLHLQQARLYPPPVTPDVALQAVSPPDWVTPRLDHKRLFG